MGEAATCSHSSSPSESPPTRESPRRGSLGGKRPTSRSITPERQGDASEPGGTDEFRDCSPSRPPTNGTNARPMAYQMARITSAVITRAEPGGWFPFYKDLIPRPLMRTLVTSLVASDVQSQFSRQGCTEERIRVTRGKEPDITVVAATQKKSAPVKRRTSWVLIDGRAKNTPVKTQMPQFGDKFHVFRLRAHNFLALRYVWVFAHQAASTSLVGERAPLAFCTSSSVMGGSILLAAPSMTRSTQRPFGTPRAFQLEMAGWPQPRSFATVASPPSRSSSWSRVRSMARIISPSVKRCQVANDVHR